LMKPALEHGAAAARCTSSDSKSERLERDSVDVLMRQEKELEAECEADPLCQKVSTTTIDSAATTSTAHEHRPLVDELRRLTHGEPWWTHDLKTLTPPTQHWTRNEELQALQRLVEAITAVNWESAAAATRDEAVELFTRYLRRPASYNEAVACCPALVHLLEHTSPRKELLEWACSWLWKLSGAETERAAQLELSLITVFEAACQTGEGRRAMLAVVDPEKLATYCGRDVLGDHALCVLRKLAAIASVHPEGPTDASAFHAAVAALLIVPDAPALPLLRAVQALEQLGDGATRSIVQRLDATPAQRAHVLAVMCDACTSTNRCASSSGVQSPSSTTIPEAADATKAARADVGESTDSPASVLSSLAPSERGRLVHAASRMRAYLDGAVPFTTPPTPPPPPKSEYGGMLLDLTEEELGFGSGQ